MSKVMSNEEIARGDAIDSRKMERIKESFLTNWPDLVPLHGIHYFSFGDGHFGFFIFFLNDSDLARAHQDGTVEKMKDSLFRLLEKFGKGKREELKVYFEFDSDENVQNKYQGNYFLRLR